MAKPPHIGTLREKPLHASLKAWYTRPGDLIEVPVEGFVIDLVRGDALIEVQTRGFSSMKRKLATLLALGHPVRIIHPIPIDRWIVKVDAEGREVSRRRSPRHGVPADVFRELVGIADLISHPDLEIVVGLTYEEELRRHEPDGPWRRKGWTVQERRLIEVVDTVSIRDNQDLSALLPTTLPIPFTSADLAAQSGTSARTAREMAYCLCKAGVVVATGRRGNSVEYRVAAHETWFGSANRA